MKNRINLWIVMFLAISLALPIYTMAQTTLTLESYTTGDRISGGPIKSFSMGPDNNLVVYLDGPFKFAYLLPPIWIQASSPCSSTVPVPYPPPSVTAISNSVINFLVCSSPSATLSMVVDPDPGITKVNGTVPANDLIPSFSSPLTIVWDTAGISSGSYLSVFQASDTALPTPPSQLVVMININPPETVSMPAVSGPATGTVNQSYTFTVTTPSTVTPSGDPVKYFFDWGDGTNSGWVSSTALAKSWTTANTYLVKVQAQCATHTSVVSAWSGTSSITISNAPTETVSTPGTPSGTTNGTVNTTYTYTTTGATSSLSHTVEYRFNWGDGNYSSWSTSMSAPKSWSSASTYSVTVEARCQTHTSISSVSSALSVIISSSVGGGALGSKTNPIPMNKYNGGISFIASTGNQDGFTPIAANLKTWFVVDSAVMAAVTSRTVIRFGFSVQGFNNVDVLYTKVVQDKAGNDLSAEVGLQNNTGDAWDQVTNNQPYNFLTTKFLYSIESPGKSFNPTVKVNFVLQ